MEYFIFNAHGKQTYDIVMKLSHCIDKSVTINELK